MNDGLTIAITGTRRTEGIALPDFGRYFALALEPFNHKDTEWFVGGAAGVDTVAVKWLRLRGHGRVTVVVPGTIEAQPADAREEIESACANEPGRISVIELEHADFPRPVAFHDRNRYMVDRSGLIIGFPHRTKPSNGTLATLEYAEGLGLPRLICPIGEKAA